LGVQCRCSMYVDIWWYISVADALGPVRRQRRLSAGAGRASDDDQISCGRDWEVHKAKRV
jgi:hypothetical protein